jgi:hypothetical protein
MVAVMYRMPPLDEQIWKLVAYLGRYGHQPADVSLNLPVLDLRKLYMAVGKIVDEENEANRVDED